MITLIRDKDPRKASGNGYTSKVISYNTHTNAGAKGDCLTFYGWVETLRRSQRFCFLEISGTRDLHTESGQSSAVALLD